MNILATIAGLKMGRCGSGERTHRSTTTNTRDGYRKGNGGVVADLELTFENVDLDLFNQLFADSVRIAPQWKLSNDETADILEKAADLYQAEQVEWCAGNWIKQEKKWDKVSVCAGGAIALAAGLDAGTFYRTYGQQYNDGAELALDPNYDKFREVLDRVAMYLGEPVPSWNDSMFTPKSKPEVIDMLRRAAKDIRDNIERESYIQ
jgi:hypothetical protein